MLIGVYIFDLNAAQAFLTWFAVAFGSFTISIGISSISIFKRKEDSD